MKHKWLIWYGILHKRLLKKISFLLILALVPLTAFLLGSQAEQGVGLVRVAAGPQDAWEPMQETVVRALTEEGEMIRVTAYATRQEAEDAFLQGKADTVWIFARDLKDRVETVAAGGKVPLVYVTAAEDNTFIRAAREKLFGALFGELSYAMLEDAALSLKPEAAQEELRAAFETYSYPQGLVEYRYLQTGENPRQTMLTAPLRGVLAAVMLLAGMASAMYFKRDERERVFSMLRPRHRGWVLLGGSLAALSITAVFVTLALIFSGLYTSFWRETALMAVFVLTAAGFCSLLGVLCPTNAALGVALPLTLVAALTLCPVFVNVRSFPLAQMLLPPWYYLYGLGNGRYLLYGLLYGAVTWAAVWYLYPLLRCRGEN